MPDPRVTVLMSVYNGERYLLDAVDSICSQTFKDFEFLIIDDGSRDDTPNILKSYDDPRIRVIGQENSGLTKSLRRGMGMASGEYVARMDADDISLPERLHKQVEFLDDHPAVAVCGTWMETIGPDGAPGTQLEFPVGTDRIKCRLLFDSPLAHPTVMIRMSVMRREQLNYDEEYVYAQDYALWAAISRKHELANLAEVLCRYRLHTDMAGALHQTEQRRGADRVRQEELKQLGLDADRETLALHSAIAVGDFQATEAFLFRAHDWLMMIAKANDKQGLYDQAALKAELAARWTAMCYHATALGIKAWMIFSGSPLSGDGRLPLLKKMKFLLRGGLKYGTKH